MLNFIDDFYGFGLIVVQLFCNLDIYVFMFFVGVVKLGSYYVFWGQCNGRGVIVFEGSFFIDEFSVFDLDILCLDREIEQKQVQEKFCLEVFVYIVGNFFLK